MTHASVFSGIGGPEVAATMLGWDNLFHCEINPFGRKVLDYWYPNSKSYEDITTTDFREWRGRVDVLTGGFPCQPFSYAGRRRGAEDDRYLWPSMYRAIDEIQPTWVVAENVAGILTMVEQGEVSKVAGSASLFDAFDDLRGRYELRETFTLQRICSDLESHGYAVQPVLVPACAVGAPHRRDRVFIVARRMADTSDARAEGMRREWQDAIHRPRHAADTDNEGLERHGGQELQSHQGGQAADEHAACGSGRLAPDPDSHRGCEVDEHMESELADGAKPVSNGGQRNVADTDCNGHQPQAASGESESGRRSDNGESCQRSEPTEWIERFHPLLRGDEAGSGRWQNFPSVSPVHRGNDGLPFDVDRLTLSFGKWRTEALKAYGNAIVPQVMYEIFRAIEIVEQREQR